MIPFVYYKGVVSELAYDAKFSGKSYTDALLIINLIIIGIFLKNFKRFEESSRQF